MLNCDLVIYGSQGSGKTTQAKILAEKLGAIFFSAGDRMRALAQTDPEIEAVLHQGKLLDDKHFEDVMEEFFDDIPAAKPIIFEGVARNPHQQKIFVNIMEEHQRKFKVIFIEASLEVAKQRLKLRRERREQARNDEQDEPMKERLRIYHEQTLPAIEQYERDGYELLRIDGNPDIKEVTEDILEKLKC